MNKKPKENDWMKKKEKNQRIRIGMFYILQYNMHNVTCGNLTPATTNCWQGVAITFRTMERKTQKHTKKKKNPTNKIELKCRKSKILSECNQRLYIQPKQAKRKELLFTNKKEQPNGPFLIKLKHKLIMPFSL